MTKISNLYTLTNYISANSSGNVVIAAPASGYALDVTGSGRFTSYLTANGYYVPDTLQQGYTTINGRNGMLVNGTSDYTSLMSGGFETMFLNSAGRVGIGTTAPSVALEVVSVIRATNSSTSGLSSSNIQLAAYNGSSVTVSGSIFQTNSTFAYQQILANQTNIYGSAANGMRLATANAPIVFSTGNSDADFSPTRMILTSGGNLGLGTSSPTDYTGFTTLHINGKSGSNGGLLRLTAFDSSSSVNIYTGANSILFNTTTSSPFIWLTQDAERMRITTGGNVGIGTTSPGQKLDVSGNIMSSGPSTILMLNNTGGTAQSWWVGQDTAGTNDGIFYIYNATSSSQAINIRKNNNVLLGTTTDIGARLHSNGNIISSGSGGSNGLLSRENSSTSTYGFFNAGNSSLVLTNSGVANVGYFAMSSGNYVATSDKNKKKDFEVSELGLSEILQLIPTLYRFKTESNNSQKHIGFIAQEVKDIIPQAYKEQTLGEETFIGLENTAFIPVLVKAIQELKAELDTLKNK